MNIRTKLNIWHVVGLTHEHLKIILEKILKSLKKI